MDLNSKNTLCRYLCAMMLLMSVCRVAAQQPQLGESLVFEERVFDFGEIDEAAGLVSHEFHFQNQGNTVLAISSVVSGCGCVKFEYPKKPLRPGEKGTVKVYYNPRYRPGFFSKEVVVLTQNNTQYNRIWVKGTVKPCRHPVQENYPYDYGNGLWMGFEVMAFGKMELGQKKTMKLRFANDTDRTMKLFFIVIGGNTDISFTSPYQIEARAEGVMPVTYTYSGKFPVETHVYPVINGVVSEKPLKVTCNYL